jgi:hypothetical protein
MQPQPGSSPGFVALAIALLASSACASCSSRREAYAVGSYVGGGSMIFGATGCTYEAKRAVADLAEDRRTGTLVGAGEIVETCGQSKRTFDVLKPTSARVTGPSKVAVGAHHDEPFHIVLLADNRELTYANAVNWTLGHDCAGKAVIQKNPGAQDTGRDEKNLWLETKGKGQCTVIGDVLGQQAEKLVSIE